MPPSARDVQFSVPVIALGFRSFGPDKCAHECTVHGGGDAFDRHVREVMTTHVQTIDHRARIEDLFPILDSGLVAVVADKDGFHGLITRIDLLNYLRRRVN